MQGRRGAGLLWAVSPHSAAMEYCSNFRTNNFTILQWEVPLYLFLYHTVEELGSNTGFRPHECMWQPGEWVTATGPASTHILRVSFGKRESCRPSCYTFDLKSPCREVPTCGLWRHCHLSAPLRVTWFGWGRQEGVEQQSSNSGFHKQLVNQVVGCKQLVWKWNRRQQGAV